MDSRGTMARLQEALNRSRELGVEHVRRAVFCRTQIGVSEITLGQRKAIIRTRSDRRDAWRPEKRQYSTTKGKILVHAKPLSKIEPEKKRILSVR